MQTSRVLGYCTSLYVKTLVFLFLGRLLIYYIQKAPYLQFLKVRAFWKELLECDLCLGWWVYLGLSFVLGEVWLVDVFYVPIISQILTTSMASFVMWLIAEGWNSKFRELNVKFED